MIKVDIESTFEPIIGSKEQAEAFIQYLQSHGENNKEAIFDCDVFGRKLGDLINEGMRVKLASMNETACIRVHDILSKNCKQREVKCDCNSFIKFVIALRFLKCILLLRFK